MSYFLSPKVLFGSGMLKRLGSEIEGKGSKAVIVTGKNMASLAPQVAEVLKASGYEVAIWDGAEPEPSVDSVQKGSKFLLEHNPQIVVGFGGGSVIDSAKAAWVLYERPEMTTADLTSVNPKTKLNLRKKARFIAIPTTSGTGSDVTWAIVLSDTASHRKIGFANNEILPDISVLVPELTQGMPKGLTASTGLDVLGHAFDGLTARQQNDFSEGLCLQAMKLVFDWLPKAYEDGNDITARAKMQNASTIAGLGFGNSNTALGHALGHAVGSVFGIGHGKAIGITLSYSLEFMASNIPLPNTPSPVEKMALAARFCGIDATSATDAVKKLILKVKELQKKIGEPLSLKEAEISEAVFKEKLDQLVSLASKDVNMYSSPCECKDESLRQLLVRIWQGYS